MCLAACCPKANKQASLVEKKVCFISDVSNWGARRGADPVGLCSSLFKDRVIPPSSHPREAMETPGKKSGCCGHVRGLLIELPRGAVQAFLWSSWEVPGAPAEGRREDLGYGHCTGKPRGLHGSTGPPDGKDLPCPAPCLASSAVPASSVPVSGAARRLASSTHLIPR